MKRRSNLPPLVTVAVALLLWQLLSMSGLIEPYMLPSPLRVILAFAGDFHLLLWHLKYTLLEAVCGLALAVTASFALAIVMDANRLLKQSLTPLLLFTQTMPVIALAPLLILWLGYDLAPKIALVFLTCFFPVTIGLLGAFASADNDALRLLQSMGAKKWQLYFFLKIPQGLPAFFSGLKIAASYSIIGAVVAEWLGGDAGLGVYMTRVRRSFSFDKMFAVILLVSALSLILIKIVEIIERAAVPSGRAGRQCRAEKTIRREKMKKIVKAGLLIAIAAFAFPACSKKDPGTIRVLLDWTPNTNHTGLYVAMEKGWFNEAGMKLTITQPPEEEALILLASGKAEFAVSFQEFIGPAIAKERDALGVTAIAAIINHNTTGIMSLANSGIKSPRDLAGRRFESWETPMVTALIKYIVESDGGDFSAVKMINNYSTDVLSALKTDVDAVWIFYAWEGLAAEVNNIDINYIDFGEFDSKLDFYTPILVTGTEWAAANPETVKKFMDAVSRGYDFAISHPAEAAEILLKHAPELDRELVTRSQRYLSTRYQGDSKRWGEIDSARWSGFYRWMFEQGLLEKDIGGGGFTNEYLPIYYSFR